MGRTPPPLKVHMFRVIRHKELLPLLYFKCENCAANVNIRRDIFTALITDPTVLMQMKVSNWNKCPYEG